MSAKSAQVPQCFLNAPFPVANFGMNAHCSVAPRKAIAELYDRKRIRCGGCGIEHILHLLFKQPGKQTLCSLRKLLVLLIKIMSMGIKHFFHNGILCLFYFRPFGLCSQEPSPKNFVSGLSEGSVHL